MESHSTQRRILIVDDDALIRRTLARILKGNDVTDVGSGKEALGALSRESFDVILCDLMMPEMTGMELFNRVREQNPSVGERFVFVSGGVFTAEAGGFLETVENQVIYKPFEADHVRAVVSQQVRDASPRG